MRRAFLKTVSVALASLSAYTFGIELFDDGGNLVEVQSKKETVATDSKVEILLFTASWCGPCQSLKAQLKREGLYRFVTIMDCSEGKTFSKYAKTYKFRGVPTLIVLVNGKEVARNNKQGAATLIKKYVR